MRARPDGEVFTTCPGREVEDGWMDEPAQEDGAHREEGTPELTLFF